MLVVVLERAITHAAQLAIGIELSTQRAASCAKHVLDDILRTLTRSQPDLSPPDLRRQCGPRIRLRVPEIDAAAPVDAARTSPVV